jgi:acylphosphatase
VSNGRAAKRFYVSGVVQGVGFRFFAQRVATRIGLGGYTKNLRDGRVEVYAIGSEREIAEFRRELVRGPEAASVSGVSDVDAKVDPKYEENFTIEYDN